MSRLIRDSKAKGKSPGGGGPDEPLPKLDRTTVVSHLKACQGIAIDQARAALRPYFEALDEAFNVEIDNAKSNQEVSELTGIQRLIRRNRAELERYYLGYLGEGFVKFSKGDLFTDLGRSNVGRELSLVNNEDLEETITISTITQKLDTNFAEPLWALNQRLAALRNGEAVTEPSNPASPVQFCDALRRALKVLPLSSRHKQVAYRSYEQQLPSLVGSIIEDINDYLKKTGILPSLQYVPPARRKTPVNAASAAQAAAMGLPSAGLPAATVAGLDPDQPPDVYHSALVQAIRNLQGNAGAVALPAGYALPSSALLSAAPSGGVVVSADQMLAALSVMQIAARNMVATSSSPQQAPAALDVRQVLSALGQQLQAEGGRVSESDMHTIDLVGMLFEYMLNDENLPVSVKALLSHLHTPYLKLAFVDPAFLEQHDHPARQLLNALAEAATRWIGNDGTQQHDMYNKIKAAVDRVLREYKNDLGVIHETLAEFNGMTSSILRKQELMEKRAREKAQGEERLREVKVQVNSEMRRRMDGKELPSAVLLFVLQPWSDYLSFTLLRYGEKSENWQAALAVVDDLLWALEPKQGEADVARQSSLAGSLAEEMQAGFDTIGYDQIKGKKLIEAIVNLLQMALHNQKPEPAPLPMRDELEKVAAEKAGQLPHAGAGLSQQESRIVENLKMIEFGTWFEFENGRRLKVAWYNARTSHYMLVDQMGKCVATMSGVEIAREMIAKRAKIIAGSSKPFFERALENIFQKLNAQAEAQAGGQVR